MKTTDFFLRSVLLMFLLYTSHFASDPAASLSPVVSTAIRESLLTPPVPKDRWLMGYICHDTELTDCCCADGNSRVCSLLSMAFYCPAGGIFECTGDLHNCEGIPAECWQCCTPCMA